MFTFYIAFVLACPSLETKYSLPECPPELRGPRADFLTDCPMSFNHFKAEVRNDCKRLNLDDWRDNRGELAQDPCGDVRVPTRAKMLSGTLGIRRLFRQNLSRPFDYRPWHTVFQARAGVCDSLVGEVVCYSLLPAHGSFLAVIENTPYLTVRANSIEELERKVVARFKSYIEDQALIPISSPRTPAPAGISNFNDGVIAGISFTF